MDTLYIDILVGFITTILSFDFMYSGWIMIKQKRKILIWPGKLIFYIISRIFGSKLAERRREIFLKKVKHYEISVFLGGGLGFISGSLLIVSAIGKLV